MTSPVFAVIGHVNRGKSSIVSTLAADETVRIEPYPGTTRACREFPMRLGGQTLYTLIDTPGFERPRQMLAWLRQHETTTAGRQDAVRDFVHQHEKTGQFDQECLLLRPVLDGAAILYVVDGSKPFSPKYEAEMEIIRWTGQPRMALVNPVEEPDYLDQWQSVLDQYFNMVRLFDSHEADFSQRIRLLRTLGELNQQWRASLERAVHSLVEDRRCCTRGSARAVAGMLVDMLTLVVEKKLGIDADPSRFKADLAEKYYRSLRDREKKSRAEIRHIYMQRKLQVQEPKLDAVEDDLFAEATWNALGLGKTQLATAGAVGGTLVGGGIDAMVGGASLLLGAIIGGTIGGATSWYGASKLPRARALGLPLGGKKLQVGPMKNPNFPWIILDRALLFHDLAAGRPHARREAVDLTDPGPASSPTCRPACDPKSKPTSPGCENNPGPKPPRPYTPN